MPTTKEEMILALISLILVSAGVIALVLIWGNREPRFRIASCHHGIPLNIECICCQREKEKLNAQNNKN